MLKNMFWTHCAAICTLYVLVSWVRSFDTELSSKLIDSCLYVRLWTSHISSEFFCAWLFVSLRAVVLHTYLHLDEILSGENFNELKRYSRNSELFDSNIFVLTWDIIMFSFRTQRLQTKTFDKSCTNDQLCRKLRL